ncbi:MAG: hypothetical protein Q8K99_09405 [Actinomycetota bacterium]|nr:hypothetical protein [Actinomycetota bacterium]
MRLFVVIPVAVLVVCTAAMGLAWVSGDQASFAREPAAEPRTGMEILNAHACGRGETKRIIIRGVEDGYSPAGEEPGFIRAGRTQTSWLPLEGTGQFDQVNADRGLTDSFKVDGPVSGGIFLIRARSMNGSDNDSLTMGDLGGDAMGPRFGTLLASLGTDPNWVAEGDRYYARLEDIALDRPANANNPTGARAPDPSVSLRSYRGEAPGSVWLDVLVQDDTAVDFMGLALCSPPTVRRGVTLANDQRLSRPEEIHLACHFGRNGGRRCDPYVGDTTCSTLLSVACLRPGDAPSPVDAVGVPVSTLWSGADIAVTEPVRGDHFRTIDDVDAFCARRFGVRWRSASIHDGGRYQSLVGRGDPRTVRDRVWVDIVDQPHGTCWKRQ